MKKIISAIMVTAMCMGLFGCASTPSEPEKPVEVDISQFPKADYFDVYEWPTVGPATMLPIPMWSNRGSIDYNNAKSCWITIGYSTISDFKQYVKDCQEIGFIENYTFWDDDWYRAENTEGYSLTLSYDEDDQTVDIQIGLNAKEIIEDAVDELESIADEYSGDDEGEE